MHDETPSLGFTAATDRVEARGKLVLEVLIEEMREKHNRSVTRLVKMSVEYIGNGNEVQSN